MPTTPPSDGTFAGYRLLRTLGTGSRSHVYLAAGPSGPVALKVYSHHVQRDSVGVELTALGRVESPHLVRLLDVAGMGDEIPSLVLEVVRRGSVASLLRERSNLERGEVVTLLAPVARLVTELQRAGVAHGRLAPASVYLGDGGEPILLGLGHATLFAPGQTPAALDDEPAAVEDRRDLATFASTLLGRVREAGDESRSLEFSRWLTDSPARFEFADELEERLFNWAEAAPIAFGPGSPSDAAVPARAGVAVPQASLFSSETKPATTTPATAGAEGLPRWLSTELVEDPFGEMRRRAINWLAGVRRRYWMTAGAVVVALVLALSLLPSQSAHSRRVARETPVAVPTRTAAALPDDPLLALPLLLRARATCFHDLSVLCLNGVDEESSQAFTSDAAAIQQIQQGGEVAPAPDGHSGALIERLGDSALLSLGADSDPASVLEIRTEAGWRIRDFLSGRQATSAPSAPAN